MPNSNSPEGAGILRRVAKAIRANKQRLVYEVVLALFGPDESMASATTKFAALESWKQETLNTVVELLEAWFDRGDELSEKLFAGWLYAQLEPMNLHAPGLPFNIGKIAARITANWAAALTEVLSQPELQVMSQRLGEVVAQLSTPERKRLRVLYVGDCLLPEIMTSLNGPCMEAQIGITHTFLHEHVAPVLRNQIRALGRDDFDLVFYSPFTHSFLPEYGQVLSWHAATWSRSKFMTFVDDMLEQVSQTARVLSGHLNSPIYIHNTAATVQGFGFWSGIGKNVFAQRNRGTLQALIKQRISRLIQDPQFGDKLRLLDETSLLNKSSSYSLGNVFFNSVIFHPTRLGIELGQSRYFEAVYATAFLSTKKVVVCDLDNTLWQGVIGEGAVTPFDERQAVLKKLRSKGVLLSINSKNDPANVHFSGSVLQMDDFVAPQINWQPKTENMASIVRELNLKVKDFVFLDDRPDELERMQAAFPELVVLDATEPRTWTLLEHWEQHLSPNADEGDRTKLYHERVARDRFVAGQVEQSSAQEDETAAFFNLQLSINLEVVGRSGLKRVVELINRTNQFNLCGTRTSLNELEAGLGEKHWIVTAAAKDKFGNMGVVGAMKVDRKPDGIEIPIFVLSCRVFGFGIERALLNAVKDLSPGDRELIGLYKETPSNKPSRNLYPDSGFSWDGNKWVGRTSTLLTDPEWLKVSSSIAQQVHQ